VATLQPSVVFVFSGTIFVWVNHVLLCVRQAQPRHPRVCCVSELGVSNNDKLCRGVTALQRQREREEQRRLKRERAQQRRKKKNVTDGLYHDICSVFFIIYLMKAEEHKGCHTVVIGVSVLVRTTGVGDTDHRSRLVDQERMMYTWSSSPAGVNDLSFLQCFDAVDWATVWTNDL